MSTLRRLPPAARQILELARTDRAAAREAVAKLGLEEQVALVCESPASRRAALIDLAPEPERLIPALPPAELCFVARAVGLHDAAWLLEHATAEQLGTCVDLDAWRELAPDRGRVGEWIAALAEAGEETLLRGVHAVEIELLVLHLKSRVAVELRGRDDDEPPPPGAQTLDGQFHLTALDPKDDLADALGMLRTLFQRDYWFYFRLLQAVTWELENECEEWALRWRTGRLQDLGFPPWEEAMELYGYLRPERRAELPASEAPPVPGEWPLPVWMPRLPGGTESDHLLLRALAGLPEAERRPYLYAFVALANQVAVADRLPLGDAESLPLAIEKGAALASAGLEHLARENGLEPADVLRRTSLPRLFRVGFNLDDSLRPPVPLGTEDAEDAEDEAAGEDGTDETGDARR